MPQFFDSNYLTLQKIEHYKKIYLKSCDTYKNNAAKSDYLKIKLENNQELKFYKKSDSEDLMIIGSGILSNLISKGEVLKHFSSANEIVYKMFYELRNNRDTYPIKEKINQKTGVKKLVLTGKKEVISDGLLHLTALRDADISMLNDERAIRNFYIYFIRNSIDLAKKFAEVYHNYQEPEYIHPKSGRPVIYPFISEATLVVKLIALEKYEEALKNLQKIKIKPKPKWAFEMFSLHYNLLESFLLKDREGIIDLAKKTLSYNKKQVEKHLAGKLNSNSSGGFILDFLIPYEALGIINLAYSLGIIGSSDLSNFESPMVEIAK